MKYFYALMFLIFSNYALSQKSLVDTKVILNNGDTVKGKMRVWTHLFDTTDMRPDSFQRRVRMESEGNFTRYKSKNVSYLYVTDLKGESREFLAGRHIAAIEDEYNKRLFEKKVTGELNWYALYYTNTYDMSLVQANFIWESGSKETIKCGAFCTFNKKIAKSFFKNDAEWYQKFKDARGYDEIERLLVAYNAQYPTESN